MNKKLVFDMDGTLLNSMGMWRNYSAKLENIKLDTNKLRAIEIDEATMLNYVYESVKNHFLGYDKGQVLSYFDNYFSEFYGAGDFAKNNIKEVLKKLFDDGYDMYLATATDYKYAKAGMESHGIDKFIKKIYTPNTLKIRKNDIRYYEYISNDLGVAPNEIVFFDDVLYALTLALKAGFTTVAVQDEHAAHDLDKIKQVSDYYINDFSEILEILK